MTQRCENWEEEWAELAVKELLAMEGRCERKERELRAMAEAFQEQEDQLASIAFTLQIKKLAAFSATSQHQEAVLQEKITQELAQQLEINKLKEMVSVLEGEMEEKHIILMAQEEEQRNSQSAEEGKEADSVVQRERRSQLRRALPAGRRRDPDESGWSLALTGPGGLTPRDSRPPIEKEDDSGGGCGKKRSGRCMEPRTETAMETLQHCDRWKG
ncbi:hypothetical protein SKAU_G00129950 [Synaphobranchus kaupii]|uniref:Uncharacterized protein n=1 Tax=Synaphobranchus kaupii TaxID=118154 RepID=A0A9Q1FQF1_SYNKA|nr:hypothetical protein SKAU_G00129950 [Synaphobranchus kaupii]